MPKSSKRPCNHPACGVLVFGKSYCEKHKPYSKQTNNNGKNLYGRDWRKKRLAYLQVNPLCIDCAIEGRTTAATIVDHIKPHHGDITLFNDSSNWQALCKQHHDRKTADEDGGFGRY